ncbi:MAG: GntR family transcriptional regulator, partial [Anaerolineales bacterium]
MNTPIISKSLAYSVPLYVQIAEGLINQIESGDLAVGERLPPERELSEKLGVNRMTLRRALQILKMHGLIHKIHGVGTFVAESKIDRQMNTVFRFTLGMQKRGFIPGSKLISLEQRAIDTALSRDLGVAVSSLAYHILRLRTINQEPVLIESYTIPKQLFPDLDHYDLESRSIYEVMENEYGTRIIHARQIFEPVLASEFEAELLLIEIGAPLMMEKRISFDQDNRPVEYG